MFSQLDDTIVAISSPPGSGVRGVLRLSGPQAFELASTVFTPADGSNITDARGHQRLCGSLRIAEDATLPAEAYTFRAPASYTRQDLVELHAIGSPPVLAILLERLTAGGARIAEPGEFTGRAYLSGAMDLTRVEGVAAMIHAQTDAQMRASEALLHGALSRRTHAMRDELADLLALIEAEIDFAEEPIEFISSESILATIERTAADLQELLEKSESVERLELCPRIVLVGLPNAGKSTLFNALTGVDRAIQSATAGTTRDVIVAPLKLAHGEVLLCDTAGVFTPSETSDPGLPDALALLEKVEIATARAIATADLILVVLDILQAPVQTLATIVPRLKGRRYAIVVNKIDQLQASGNELALTLGDTGNVLAEVSAATGRNIDQLLLRLDENLLSYADKQGEALLSLSNRQRQALREAVDALHRARELVLPEACADTHRELLAMEIRQAMQALSLLLGEVTTEDLLGRIFSRFCIGK